MDKKIKFLDLLGLESIGIFSLGYICFSVPFAELHIQLSFLDFPIFIGEILLFICLLAFVFKCYIAPPKLNKWHYALIFYSVFVVGKALYGYAKWGPLAFRDAALLYYPVFILFGYSFYRRDYFDNKRIFFLFSLIMLIFIGRTFSAHWALALFILGLILANGCSHRALKYVMSAALLLCAPYKLFFYTARMMLAGNLTAGLAIITLCSMTTPFKRGIKLMFVILGIFFISFGVWKLSNTTRAKSIIGIKEMVYWFKEYDRRVQAKIDHYKLKELKDVKVFNPGDGENSLYSCLRMAKFGQDPAGDISQSSMTRNRKEARLEVVVEKEAGQADAPTEKIPKPLEKLVKEEHVAKNAGSEIKQDFAQHAAPGGGVQPQEQPVEPYDIQTGYNNALFRLFIWRDMIRELAQKKPIAGFDFGKPLRSVSLEILNWGTVDWQRDGWIAPHNSYLHILYRAGVMGVVFIFAVFLVLFRMIGRFIQLKSIIGILLCGIIIDWFVAANFLLILELPYTAIPIWSLYGMTLAYCYKKENSAHALGK